MRLLLALFTFIILLFPSTSQAQYFDTGIFYGVSSYQGDLSPNAMDPSQYNLALGAFLRYHLSTRIAVKTHLYGGTLTGTDAFSARHRTRNLHFKSNILEWGVQGEYSLFSYEMLDKTHISTPYILAGLSAFYFNPYAEYRGVPRELRILGTEGQGLKGYDDFYKRVQLSIPLGLGIKVAINQTTNIGIEFGVRKTFTDYIDDVSGNYPDLADLFEQRGSLAHNLSFRSGEYDDAYRTVNPSGNSRGNPNNNDLYFFGGVTLSINFKPGKNLADTSIRKKARFSQSSYTQRYLF